MLFLYGPIITILVLSFQGPTGGLTFPMRGVSVHWFASLWSGLGVVDIWAAFRRSVALGAVVMVLTVLVALPAGYAFRRGFRGAGLVFYTAVASLIVPSIIVSLGIGVQFRLIDDGGEVGGGRLGLSGVLDRFTAARGCSRRGSAHTSRGHCRSVC